MCPYFPRLAEGGVFLGKAVQRGRRARVLTGVRRALGAVSTLACKVNFKSVAFH